MLRLIVPPNEKYNEFTGKFVEFHGATIQLEHSLVSISKWEQKWHKPFLTNEKKTIPETVDYIRCMTLTQNVPPEVYDNLTDANIEAVNAYIEDPMTATWFSKEEKGGSREIITNEIIYYWMITLNIPVEFQKWHLNHLLTLIQVCNLKNSPQKKLSREELAARNRKLNAERRAAMNSKG